MERTQRGSQTESHYHPKRLGSKKRNINQSENHYYPLRLGSKFEHKDHGRVPSVSFTKWKRWQMAYYSQAQLENDCFYNILFKMYLKMHKLINSDIGTQPDLMRCFRAIIPKDYYGSLYNRRKLFFIIKRIVTQTQGECIHLCVLYEDFDYYEIPWLDTEDNFMVQILQANILVFQTVIKPFIRYYYYLLKNFNDRGFSLIPRGQGDSFFHKNIAKVHKLRHIYKVDSNTSRAIGRLKLHPKYGIAQSDYRPIIRGYNLGNELDIKFIKNKLKRMAEKYVVGGSLKLYNKWIKFVQENHDRKRLYAIKVDLQDAFGLIEIKELETIIIKSNFLFHEEKFLLNLLHQQYVNIRGNKQVYKWEHGLLQGFELSPHLCELYLSYIIKDRLKGLKMNNCFFHRTVDDILFISTSEEKINDFEVKVFGMAILNSTKTQRYLDENKDDPIIVFCGKSFNLKTRETCTPYNFKKRQNMSTKFKLWNFKIQFSEHKAYSFLIHAMEFSPLNNCFSKFDLNTICNSLDSVVKNIFNGFCYVAIKLICAVEAIEYLFANVEERCELVIKVINKIITTYTVFINRIILKCKGENYKPIFLNFLFRYLCYKACLLVFNRRNFNYKKVIFDLKQKLKNLYVPNFKTYVDVKYVSRLPKSFENVRLGRVRLLDKK